MENSELLALLSELKFKTTPDSVPEQSRAALCDFLRHERDARSLYRVQRLLLASGMQRHQLRTFEQFDWNFNPTAPKNEITAFRQAPWVENAANLVIIGDVGLGKSHIARALCYDAVSQGHSAYFVTAFDLISKIKKSLSCANKINYYGKTLRVLCIDELGYTVYQKDDTDILFQIISKRSEILPTIVTTNLAPKQWGSIFTGSAASAILDRLSYNGKFLTWEGKSYRASSRTK